MSEVEPQDWTSIAEEKLASLFGTGGDARLLRAKNPVPVSDENIGFYEYLFVDEKTRRKVDVPMNHDTGELEPGAVVPPGAVRAEHKYFYRGVPQSGSATGFMSSFFASFNAEREAGRIAQSTRRLTDAGYKYFGVGEAEMRQEWLRVAKSAWVDELPVAERCRVVYEHSPDSFEELLASLKSPHRPLDERLRDKPRYRFAMQFQSVVKQLLIDQWAANGNDAMQKGRAMHRAIELCYNGAVPLASPVLLTPEMRQFAAFHENWVLKRGLEIFRTELSLAFCPEDNIAGALLCGTIDAVFCNKKTGKFALVDWKRSIIKEAAFRESDVGFGPCAGLPNCNLSKYQMQLNTYDYKFTLTLEREVESCHIVAFHPTKPSYAVYDVPDMKERVAAAMKLYAEETNNGFCERIDKMEICDD